MKYFFYLCLFLLVACHQPTETIIMENNIRKPEITELPISSPLYVREVSVTPNYLFFIDSDQPFFHIYNKGDISYEGNLGSVGQGPNEFTMPLLLKNTDVIGDTIQVYDLGTSSIVDIVCKNMEIINSRSFPSELMGSPNIQIIDGIIYGNKDVGPGQYFIYSDKGMKWIPFVKEVLAVDEDNAFVNGNRISVSPSKHRVVSAMRFYNLVCLYDIEGNLMKSVCIAKSLELPQLDNSGVPTPESKIYATDICSTDKLICILFHSVSQKDFNYSSCNNSRIVCLDWDLNYLCTYQLSEYVSRICYDSSNKKVIYISVDADGNKHIKSFVDT